MKSVALSKTTRWHTPEHHKTNLHRLQNITSLHCTTLFTFTHTDNIASNDSSCWGACAQSPEMAINFMHVRLCAVPTGRTYVWNLIFRPFMKIWRKNSNLIKIGQNIGHCTWKRKYVSLFQATLHRSALSDWNSIRLLDSPSISLPVCPHVSAWLPMDGFTWSHRGDLYEIA